MMAVALTDDPPQSAGDHRAAGAPPQIEVLAFVRRCQAGDRLAWRWLYDQHFPPVYRLVRRMGVFERDAADVCQEVFVRAFRGLRHFRGDAQFSTWLYRIAINEVRRAQRVGVLRRALAVALGQEPTVTVAQPDQAAIESEAFGELQRILADMKEKKRIVFVLYELEELSPSAIADVLGCSVDTVKSRLRHARAEFEQLRRRRQLVGLSGGKR